MLKVTDNKNTPVTTVVRLVLVAVMTALVFVSTFLFRIPFPSIPGGYFNFGDIMIFFTALTFGPVTGGIAGGLGSSLADVALGSANFAPFTLIVKGLEGLVAGSFSQSRFRGREVIAWIAGGAVMVVGYFVTVAVLYGLPAAIFPELPGDVAQVVAGGLVGIPLSRVLRKSLPAMLVGSKAPAPRPTATAADQ